MSKGKTAFMIILALVVSTFSIYTITQNVENYSTSADTNRLYYGKYTDGNIFVNIFEQDDCICINVYIILNGEYFEQQSGPGNPILFMDSDEEGMLRIYYYYIEPFFGTAFLIIDGWVEAGVLTFTSGGVEYNLIKQHN